MYFAEEAALKQRHSEWHRSDPEFQRERHLALLQEAHRSHHVLKKEEKSSQIVRKECLPLNGLPEEHSVADTLIAFSKHLRDDWRYDDEDDDDHDGSDGVSDNATHVSEGETVW